MLRRYSGIKPSRGTVIPTDLRQEVTDRDRRIVGGNGCVMRYVGAPMPCGGDLQLDHVRASNAIGMKSPTEAGNLVVTCAYHHRMKTENGRQWRPPLLVYLATAGAANH